MSDPAEAGKSRTRDRLPEMGGEYRRALIASMAKVWGDRPSNAVKIDSKRELGLWMQPTSPAAVAAIDAGGTPEEVEQANALWAAQMKADGASDEEIFKTCRRFAYALGKQHAKADLTKETAYHEEMAAKAAAYRAGRLTFTTLDEQAPTPPAV